MTSMLGQGPQLLWALQPLTQATQAPMQMAQSGLGPLQSMMGMFMQGNAPVAAETAGLGAIGAPLGGGGERPPVVWAPAVRVSVVWVPAPQA